MINKQNKKNKLPINILTYKKYYAFIDIESYNDIANALPYDISIYIMLNDEVIEKYCILYVDCFIDDDIEKNCYFRDKIPLYEYQQHLEENKDIQFIYLSKYDMLCKINEIFTRYNIKLIIGYNVNFDYRAINRLYTNVNNTIKRKKRRFRDLNLIYKDIPPIIKNHFTPVNYFDLYYGITELFIANELMFLQYIIFTLENDLITESFKSISSKEEHIYMFYIDMTHKEWHLGFKDIIDEIQLYKHFKQLLRTRLLNKKHFLQLNTNAKKSIYNLINIKRILKKYGLYDKYKDKLDYYKTMQ